jgi:hypothetical protein
VTLATLGYGDIVPTSDLLRVLVPLEALVGFALLTAALSWVISVYPALSRRRSLARGATLLKGSEQGVVMRSSAWTPMRWRGCSES